MLRARESMVGASGTPGPATSYVFRTRLALGARLICDQSPAPACLRQGAAAQADRPALASPPRAWEGDDEQAQAGPVTLHGVAALGEVCGGLGRTGVQQQRAEGQQGSGQGELAAPAAAATAGGLAVPPGLLPGRPSPARSTAAAYQPGLRVQRAKPSMLLRVGLLLHLGSASEAPSKKLRPRLQPAARAAALCNRVARPAECPSNQHCSCPGASSEMAGRLAQSALGGLLRPCSRHQPCRRQRQLATTPVCMGRRSSKIAGRKVGCLACPRAGSVACSGRQRAGGRGLACAQTAQDMKKAKVYGRIGKLISREARAGGSDPVANSRLGAVLQQAKLAGVPKDIVSRNLARALDKSQGDFAEVQAATCVARSAPAAEICHRCQGQSIRAGIPAHRSCTRRTRPAAAASSSSA